MTTNPKKWNLVTSYPITEYQCGAKAGQKVRLRRDIIVTHKDNIPTGKVLSAGEIWTVIPAPPSRQSCFGFASPVAIPTPGMTTLVFGSGLSESSGGRAVFRR